MKKINFTANELLSFVVAVATSFMIAVRCSILNDIHVVTGELFGNRFPNDQNNPFLRELKASETICMDELGCFGTEDEAFFHPVHRPVNVLPYHKDFIQTRFLLFTRMNKEEPIPLNTRNSFSLTKSTFDPRRKTKFIIHGFMDNIFFITWMMEMKDLFLRRGDYNLIVVDWSKGNKMPYTQATANTRVVGAEIALLIRKLENLTGVTQESFHCIGHSLGSHICGYAGERLEKLGRITGMDPAGPYFLHMPPKVRLDPTDALFVDAWHTDADTILHLSLGANEAVGHVDYFPNNGRKQPGCNIGESKTTVDPSPFVFIDWLAMFSISNIYSELRNAFICNHDRATKLFMDTILRKEGECRHMAYVCPDYSSFAAGKCADCGPDGKGCAMMGYDMEDTKYRLLQKSYYNPYGYLEGNKTASKKYFLATTREAPYCLFHYQIVIEMSGNQLQEGKIKLEVGTASGSTYSFQLHQESETFLPGSTHVYLVTSETRLSSSQVVGVSLTWTSSATWSSVKRELHVRSLKIVPLEYSTRSAQASHTMIFGGGLEARQAPGHRLVLPVTLASF